MKPVAIATLLVLGLAPALAAQADYYLKIDTIEGEADDSKHRGEIEILSWSFGASNPGMTAVRESPTRANTGKVMVRESPTKASTGKTSIRESSTGASAGGVHVAAGDLDGDGRADLAGKVQVQDFHFMVPAGSALCAKGKHIAKATLTARSGGAVYVFEDLMVTSCSGDKVTVTGSAKHTKTGHVTLLK